MSIKENELTQQVLKGILDYDKDTGVFFWKKRSGSNYKSWNTRYAGTQAGVIGKQGSRNVSCYILITITLNGIRRTHYAHRLAWLYVTGEWPYPSIDHKDMDGTNNRWINLRLANLSQNIANRKAQKNNILDTKGVGQSKTGRYKVRITVHGKTIYLGSHEELEGAASLYRAAAIKYYGKYARTD